jgi:hypothetical protein
VEGEKGCKGEHLAHKETSKVLCQNCYSYRVTYQRDRPLPDMSVLREQVQSDRREGRLVSCSDCQAIEKHTRLYRKAWRCIPEDLSTLPPCQLYYTKHGSDRPPHLQRILEGRAQPKEDRKERRPIICTHCQIQEGVEEGVEDARKFVLVTKSLAPVCKLCLVWKHRK